MQEQIEVLRSLLMQIVDDEIPIPVVKALNALDDIEEELERLQKLKEKS